MTIESLKESRKKGVLHEIFQRFGRVGVCLEICPRKVGLQRQEKSEIFEKLWEVDCDPLPPWTHDQYADYIMDEGIEKKLQTELNGEKADAGEFVVIMDSGQLSIYRKSEK